MGHLTNAMCDKCRPVEQLKQSTLASSRVNGMVISMSWSMDQWWPMDTDGYWRIVVAVVVEEKLLPNLLQRRGDVKEISAIKEGSQWFPTIFKIL